MVQLATPPSSPSTIRRRWKCTRKPRMPLRAAPAASAPPLRPWKSWSSRWGALRISADVIESNSFAQCNPASSTVAVNGNSTIVNLKINGRPIDVSGPPNTRIVIPLVATVIINERTQPDVNSVVVNAVHIIVPGVPGVAAADIVIARAASGILTCS